MTVQRYEWGMVKGGYTPSGPAAPAESSYGPEDSFTGTLPAAGNLTITFANPTKSIHIRNTDDINSMQFSLDSGTNWFTILAYGSRDLEVMVPSLLLRAVAGTPTYEVIGVLTS